MKLSCISFHSPMIVPLLLPALEQSGYSRFWTTEHYSELQSGSPSVLMMLAALLTHELRIGAAGFMLRTRTPVSVVSEIRLLERFFQGRIDLGVIAGAPPDEVAEQILEGRALPSAEGLCARFQQLLDLLHHRRVGNLDGRMLGPCEGDAAPEVWMCSGNEQVVRFAAERGCGFAYHDTILGRRPELIARYREWFRPTERAPAPRVVVAVTICCHEDRERARRAVAHLTPPMFAGNFEDAHAHVRELLEVYGCDEIALGLKTESEGDLPDAYARIGRLAGLTPRAAVE